LSIIIQKLTLIFPKNVAKLLSFGGFLSDHFIANLLLNVAVKKTENGQYLKKVQQKLDGLLFGPLCTFSISSDREIDIFYSYIDMRHTLKRKIDKCIYNSVNRLH